MHLKNLIRQIVAEIFTRLSYSRRLSLWLDRLTVWAEDN